MRSFESSPEAQLKRMDEAGIFGGCVFSIRPKEMNPKTGLDFEERLNQVLDWCRPFPDRLFPVLWIHPFEEDILKKVHIAAERGITAFKIICNNFYIYEEKPSCL